MENKRIILDFSPGTMDKIDSLKDKVGARSRSELIRYALGLLLTYTELTNNGYVAQFKKGDTEAVIAAPLF